MIVVDWKLSLAARYDSDFRCADFDLEAVAWGLGGMESVACGSDGR
jgi:hypothetical protein